MELRDGSEGLEVREWNGWGAYDKGGSDLMGRGTECDPMKWMEHMVKGVV